MSERPEKQTYISRAIKITVMPKGEPIFSEQATNVEIDDDAAGEFVKVSQCRNSAGESGSGAIFIEPDEWPELQRAICQMMASCLANGQ